MARAKTKRKAPAKSAAAIAKAGGKFSIVSSWPTMAAAQKALRTAKDAKLKVRRVFGKFSVVKPKAKVRARNSSDAAAAEMYKKFHGRAPDYIEEIDVPNNQRVHMAECGKLRHLHVVTGNGDGVKFTFKGVKVCCSPDGGQLYLVKGDQRLDLEALGLAETLPKDHLDIGLITRIEYETQKGFHDFEDVEYWHKFGEEDGRLPTLHFDVLNKLCYISGGGYQVRPEGIVN